MDGQVGNEVAVGWDGSPGARAALALVRRVLPDRPVVAVTVGAAPGPDDPAVVRRVVVPAPAAAPARVGRAVAVALVEAAAGTAVLVVGASSTGHGDLLGSTASAIVEHAGIPVLLAPVPPGNGEGFVPAETRTSAVGVPEPRRAPGAAPAGGTGSVVVGVDGSASGRAALRWAVAEAARTGRAVRAVRVWDPAVLPVDQLLAELRAAEQAALAADVAGSPAAAELREGPVAAELCRAAEGAALLVVGGHGRGRLGRMLLGSVSAACLQHARCPVVVLTPAAVAADHAAGQLQAPTPTS
ncbi:MULTISPECIES: universal stress protein [Pseudonocardia]|uniref:Universal stress protein n=2 Tax=Pseudonocardia TaxID=1847 RepID=A0A1Y2N886_PSEAH|nr:MULTISPECIES: universal stress protein [Pseudonocardia]OSY43297.1 Universal stress protein [Pseudonocardia autotrophica]TDN71785.1 nucleotide-binding universal stress UspA family protein [Pseudonocardia autotrophica]BBG02473.1 hypothetical protein Pdca_36820 [Pseudonocardia autotrophica]GEC26947.1 hypothetical protein PSA01_39760 [Pseudonocardia saturnea]